MAIRQADDSWSVSQPIRVAQVADLFPYLKSQRVQPGCILLGFDFPIGLPYAYATKAGLGDFLSSLPIFGRSEWADFYSPADHPAQIGLHRPFYPARPGGSKRHHLVEGLRIPFTQLYRLCELAHSNRRAACPLFWTMGSQQVGKAAISAWQSLLAPALLDPAFNLKIWPFAGSLHDLCQPGNIIVVETYPAEFYLHLGLSFIQPVRRSKRRQADRVALSHQLLSWTRQHAIRSAPSLISSLQDGFGSRLDGEDQFDALVGLYGMINVIQGYRAVGEPHSPVISKIEGWIFGQDQPSDGI